MLAANADEDITDESLNDVKNHQQNQEAPAGNDARPEQGPFNARRIRKSLSLVSVSAQSCAFAQSCVSSFVALLICLLLLQGAAYWHSPARHNSRKLMRSIGSKQITSALQAEILWDLGYSGTSCRLFIPLLSCRTLKIQVL